VRRGMLLYLPQFGMYDMPSADGTAGDHAKEYKGTKGKIERDTRDEQD
jgi:hypothetical protein